MKKTYIKPTILSTDILPSNPLLLVVSKGGSTDECLVKGSSESDIWSDEPFWDDSVEE